MSVHKLQVDRGGLPHWWEEHTNHVREGGYHKGATNCKNGEKGTSVGRSGVSPRQFYRVEKHADVSHYRQYKRYNNKEKHQDFHRNFNSRICIVDDLIDTGGEKRYELDVHTVEEADHQDGLGKDPGQTGEQVSVTRCEGVRSECLFDCEDPVTGDETDEKDFCGGEGVTQVGDQTAQSFTCDRIVCLFVNVCTKL